MERRRSIRLVSFALGATLAGAAMARAASAQPAGAPPGEVIVLDDRRPRGGTADLIGGDPEARDRRRGLAASAFVTVVHVDEKAGETRGVAEAIGAAAGADARSLGGLGGFTSIAVRGASPGHTQVLVDGVPLSRLGSTTADLSRFELDGFGEVELYRGGVPVALGGAGVGGALNLVTRLGRAPTGERWRITLGAGSFGARSGRVRFGDGDAADGVAYTLGLGYAGAEGDFAFFDDRGTSLTTADDRFTTRANNGFDRADLIARAGTRAGRLQWEAGARADASRQGVPGTGWDQALATSLDTVGGLVDGAVTLDEPGRVAGLVARAAAYLAGEAQAFHDPDDEVGLAAQDRRYLTVAGGAQTAWTYARGVHRVAAAAELRGDYFRDREAGASMPLRTRGSRIGAALALSDDLGLAGGRVAIEPAVRAELVRTDPLVDGSLVGMSVDLPARTEVLISPRAGVRVLALDDVAVKAGGGRYARQPTALELFGDRGYTIGRPDLRSEVGWAADAGLVWAPAAAVGALDRIYVEAAGFWARPKDAIAFVSSGALVSRPVNLPGARLQGVELIATARAARSLTVTGNYTLTDTRAGSTEASLDGKALPGRPRHALYARADLARTFGATVAAVFADAGYASGSFLDDANLARVPARWLVGAGAKVELPWGVAVGVEVKNLLDNRIETVPLDPPPRPDLAEVPRAVADFAGYPLPGRAFYLRLDLTY